LRPSNQCKLPCYCYAVGAKGDPCTATTSDLLVFCVPSNFQPFLIRPPELSDNYQYRHLVVNQEKRGEKWQLNFAYEVSLSYS
jgi:hypothetical protein